MCASALSFWFLSGTVGYDGEETMYATWMHWKAWKVCQLFLGRRVETQLQQHGETCVGCGFLSDCAEVSQPVFSAAYDSNGLVLDHHKSYNRSHHNESWWQTTRILGMVGWSVEWILCLENRWASCTCIHPCTFNIIGISAISTPLCFGTAIGSIQNSLWVVRKLQSWMLN